jgi:TonB family protein
MIPDADSGPNLLLDWHASTESPRWLRAGVGSVVVHIVLFMLAFAVGSLEPPQPPKATEIASNIRKVTPLYAPPPELTQKDPNRNKVSKEVNVEGLASTSQKPALAPPPVHTFRPPDPKKPTPEEPPPPKLAEPPKIEAAVNNPPPVPAGVPKAPPPQIQPVEKPKLALETPGQYVPSSRPATSKVSPPGTSVDEAIRSVTRGTGQGRTVVEDLEPPPNIPGTARMTQMLELQSDAMGVDFKPYLIRILALVRQNWFAVIPESARLGNRGVVQLQFIIDRNGQVPKLVIAAPSGSESLDRAAVAGVSATVPFPPLPQEFKGREIRVQFSFKYNQK